MSLMVRILCKT